MSTRPPFITLSRNDPDFRKYLLGTLPQDAIAVPVNTLHLNTGDESVTFQILNQGELNSPPFWIVLIKLLRIDLIAFTLMPVLAVFGATVASGAAQAHHLVSHMGLTVSSLFFLHGAVYCRNDFIDHLNGLDRLNEKGGSRVIQNGWVRAITVHRLARAFLIMAILFATPVLMALPQLWWLAAFGGGMGIVGYSILRQGRFGWLASDMIAFLAMGPLLTVGANFVAFKPLSWCHCVLLGAGFGLAVVTYLEIRHLISLVVDDTSNNRTLAVALGFDRAKKVVATLFCLTGLSLIFVLRDLHAPLGLLAASALLFVTITLALRTVRVNSPLASSLPNLLQQSTWVHLLYGIIFIAVLF